MFVPYIEWRILCFQPAVISSECAVRSGGHVHRVQSLPQTVLVIFELDINFNITLEKQTLVIFLAGLFVPVEDTRQFKLTFDPIVERVRGCKLDVAERNR